MIRLEATAAGRVAWEVLAAARDAHAVGSTSRGLFVRPADSRWLLFLSAEPWMSPLTVRLPRPIPAVAAGTPVRLEPGRIRLPGVEVRVPHGAEWTCPKATGPASPSAERRKTLRALAAHLSLPDEPVGTDFPGSTRQDCLVEPVNHHEETPDPDPGLGPLLPTLVGRSPAPPSPTPVMAAVLRLRERPSLGTAVPLLGLGRGLTPSGDDALLGFLLGRSRWLGGCPWAPDLVAEAYRRTTTLSANLLELAASGEADERLMAMVDHALAAGPPAWDWLTWGSTSGVDALAGLAVAASSLNLQA